jgi:hypothetical protein
MLRNLKDLRGFAIGATDGDVGTVRECYFDDVTYAVRYIVVDTGAWLSERKVLLSPIAFRAIDWEHQRITAQLTKTQVEKSPEIDTDKPVSRQHETNYFGYYGYDPYWTGFYLWGVSPYPNLGTDSAVIVKGFERERRWLWEARKGTNPHLRSSSAVTGYHIQAADGDIGHVSDFLVDDASWAIRYLVVDTTNWWPGKKVLLSPRWIDRVDWNHSKVHATVTRAQIRNSPEFDPARPIERAYEEQLYRYYGQPDYWGE